MHINKHNTDTTRLVTGTEVVSNDWQFTAFNTLLTRDIQTCIAVCLSDLKNKRGMLGHFMFDKNLVTRSPEFVSFYNGATELMDPRTTTAWVGGATQIQSNDIDSETLAILHDYTSLAKTNVTNALSSLALRHTTTEWLRVNERIEGLVFDMPNSALHYNIAPLKVQVPKL